MTALWHQGWRERLPELFGQQWDVLVIGGGITGAGILLEAARRGLKALLVEQRDFAWGTSSRSSKLVHGGLRYLKEGRIALTRESVHERERLLREAPGLVERQGFAFADYANHKPGRHSFLLGLAVYDMLAGHHERHYLPPDEFLMLAPNVAQEGLEGGIKYTDAKTDDARLVLRVLQEAQAVGGVAVNYAGAKSLLRGAGGRVTGAVIADAPGGASYEVRAGVVVNATGVWADGLRGQAGAERKLRPLRGSHLVLPAWRLPLAQAVSLMHPLDGRPVFAFPWEGVTLVGTTDVDHADDLAQEAAITKGEFDYLMEALAFQFPQLGLTPRDVIATYAGVRPVIDSGQSDPSKEPREHAVWTDHGMVTVTGGKLTTFRVIALDTLKAVAALLPDWSAPMDARPVFSSAATDCVRRLPATWDARLHGRYGAHAAQVLGLGDDHLYERIPGTETLWAELAWCARAEAVAHLEDLLLRRTRLGLQLRGGGVEQLPRIRQLSQPVLGWTDERWDAEVTAYLALWNAHYALPREYA